MVEAQGGDASQLDDPALLPQASFVEPLTAPADGVIAAMDTGAIGWACVHLGGGRLIKGEKIDHAVGLVLSGKVGDRLAAGETLGFIHANDEAKMAQACQEIAEAISWSQEPVPPLPHFYGTIE
jgi:pyrimidine-nucleoside phosphorylase